MWIKYYMKAAPLRREAINSAPSAALMLSVTRSIWWPLGPKTATSRFLVSTLWHLMLHLCSFFYQLLRSSERASFIDENMCNVKILSNYIKQVTSKIRLHPNIHLCVSYLFTIIEFPSLYCLFLKQYVFCLSWRIYRKW